MKQLIDKFFALFTKRTDYTLHFLCSFSIAAALFIMLSTCILPWAALISAVSVTAFVGIAKELIDKYLRGQLIEKGDLISDAFGILTLVVFALINIL